ncbi:MAG: penicillin-binding protein 2 [Alphaproteobacteria bacterium]|nr:penicillin-binding protein 2 [Alphaproteobacteria bacterium]
MKRENMRSKVFTRRVLMLAGGKLVLAGLLGGRLYQLQVLESDRYATLAEENRISMRLLAPPRGRILDRHGEPLAFNRLNYRALLVAEQTADIGATLETFSQLVPLSEAERARIEREARRRRRFVPVLVREHLEWDDMAKIEVNAPDLPGIVIDVGPTRVYPHGEDVAHVVGYVGPPAESDLTGEDPLLELPGIRIGRAGYERTQDLALRGRAGSQQLEVNAVGRVIRELSRHEGTPGQDIQLTLDLGLQQAAIERLGDDSAAAVVLDARNGEVLALATTPSFDPNLFVTGLSADQWRAWSQNRRAPLRNKATAGLYSPGSTFKMLVGLAALEANVTTPNERISCPGHMELGDQRFHCWKRAGHGAVNLREAIKSSCDVYFYEIARRVGIDRIAAISRRFGLGVDPEIELPGARSGLIPTRDWKQRVHRVPWQVGETLVHGIGQGFTLTSPLQLAVMTARLATGRAVKPHLTRTVGGVLRQGHRAEDWPGLGIAERHLRAMREAMWAVVNEQGGTAYSSRFREDGATMAGKTGTTQVRRISMAERERGLRRQQDLPWEWRDHALFVCYAPTDRPVYACAVVVEHGGGGSAVAAPIARDILLEALERRPLEQPTHSPPDALVAMAGPLGSRANEESALPVPPIPPDSEPP